MRAGFDAELVVAATDVLHQRLSRALSGLVRRDVEADAVAVPITGACHQAALHSYLAGEDGGPTDGRLARTLETLLAPG